jgi:hypothetical protein
VCARLKLVQENRASAIRLEGYIDKLQQELVSGWIWSPSDPGRRLTVEAVVGDKVFGQAVANRERPDLRDAGKGDGFYGFSLPLSKRIPRGQVPALRVRNHGIETGQSDDWLDFPAPDAERPAEPERVEYEGYLDVLRPEGAHGWAWHPNEPLERVSVEAVLGGRVIATGLADGYRARRGQR